MKPEKWEKEFDIEFGGDKPFPPPIDDWHFPETLNPKKVKSFIQENFISKREVKLWAKIHKKEMPDHYCDLAICEHYPRTDATNIILKGLIDFINK